MSALYLGRPLLTLEETDSTNAALRQLAQNGALEGTAVLARSQTQGRGRQGRTWHSPPGLGVYLSVLLRPAAWAADDAGWLAVLGGLAVAEALDRLGVLRVALKWPNDVLVNGRKIAGVLVEPRLAERKVEFAVLGAGINIHHRAEDFPQELRTLATSCRQEGVQTDRARAMEVFLECLERRYTEIRQVGFGPLLQAWSARVVRPEPKPAE